MDRLKADQCVERNWYRVHIDTIAEFITLGHSEDEAIARVVGYCEKTERLGIDTEMMLPHGVYGKPLEPMEEEFYSRAYAGTGIDNIKLVRLREHNPLPKPHKPTEIIVNENQLCLFSMSKVFEQGGWSLQYSFFPE